MQGQLHMILNAKAVYVVITFDGSIIPAAIKSS